MIFKKFKTPNFKKKGDIQLLFCWISIIGYDLKLHKKF